MSENVELPNHISLSANQQTNERLWPTVGNRMERELDAIESLGFKTQPWKADPDAAQSVAMAPLDIDWLIAQRELPYLVQALPTHLLYRSIMNHGVEDSLEVIEWVRGEALVRVLDYDLWTNAHSKEQAFGNGDSPSAERFIQWIKWWNEISPEFAAQRVVELDEGLIVGCMTAACEIIPVGLNRNQEELSDDYWITPDNRFGLKLKTSEASDFEILHQFVHSLYKRDVRLAQSILAHSAMLIREESIEEARRWRDGRLEEQGFLSPDEARYLLKPKSNKQLVEMIRIAVATEPKRYSTVSSSEASDASPLPTEMQERIFEYVQQIDGDELAQEIEQLLGTSELVRLVGTSAPHPEILLQDEDVMDLFVEKLSRRTHQILVNLEAQKVRTLKQKLQQSESTLLIDQTIAWLAENNLERAMDYKARMARSINTLAAAMGVVNETSELARVVSAVRGCLNVGLERLVKTPEVFEFSSINCNTDSHDSLRNVTTAAAAMTAVGPEALFQIGWQTLQDMAMDALQILVYNVDNNKELKTKIGSDFVVQLADGESVRLSVLQLQSQGRHLEVRKWMQQLASHVDPAIQHILSSTLNRLPVFPIILMEENATTRGSVEVKPYERLEEIERTRDFWKHSSRVVGFSGRED
ncbi:MAG: DUF6178 family protein [Silvanigrellaceae bacterium]